MTLARGASARSRTSFGAFLFVRTLLIVSASTGLERFGSDILLSDTLPHIHLRYS